MSESESRELEVAEPHEIERLPQEMSIEQVVARVEKVRELQKRVMKKDIHYGVIPGTPKPTLLKGGAELLLLTFMFDPQYEHEVKQNGTHREIISRCVLYHIPSGRRVGSGEGSCSTYESKYAYRRTVAACPKCGKSLQRSKQRPEWYCWAKLGGCGATFPLTDARIHTGARSDNPDLPDTYNTVLKMANKRALVAAILNSTAASEIFTQDLEDFRDNDEAEETAQPSDAGVRKPDPAPARPAPVSGPAPQEAGETPGAQVKAGKPVTLASQTSPPTPAITITPGQVAVLLASAVKGGIATAADYSGLLSLLVSTKVVGPVDAPAQVPRDYIERVAKQIPFGEFTRVLKAVRAAGEQKP